jgi:excisionase family DNA binding protein
MTLREAADRLGITPDALRLAISRGAFRAVKHGRDWWVEPREVERYRRVRGPQGKPKVPDR